MAKKIYIPNIDIIYTTVLPPYVYIINGTIIITTYLYNTYRGLLYTVGNRILLLLLTLKLYLPHSLKKDKLVIDEIENITNKIPYVHLGKATLNCSL